MLCLQETGAEAESLGLQKQVICTLLCAEAMSWLAAEAGVVGYGSFLFVRVRVLTVAIVSRCFQKFLKLFLDIRQSPAIAAMQMTVYSRVHAETKLAGVCLLLLEFPNQSLAVDGYELVDGLGARIGSQLSFLCFEQVQNHKAAVSPPPRRSLKGAASKEN